MAKITGQKKLTASDYRKMGRYDGRQGHSRFAYDSRATSQHLIDAYDNGYNAGQKAKMQHEENIRLELEQMWKTA